MGNGSSKKIRLFNDGEISEKKRLALLHISQG